MTAIAMQTNPGLRLNWPRIGALSGSLSLHAYALVLLLAPPVALQIMTHVEPAPVVVELHQVKPEEKKPEPVLPAPPTKPVHHAPTPIVHPTETSPIQVPVVDAKPDIGPIDLGPSKPAVDSGAIDVAPTAMAYGASTKVQYPLESARRREHGKVLLRVLVGADGVPQTVEIEHSSGFVRLDTAARDAVLRWKFRPGTRNGVAQSAWALVPISFDLSEL
ncbi:MAG TPA: energy transducer TonB [Rudaea sp.]|nr:energy transducer TonB [Rudaea sp.]